MPFFGPAHVSRVEPVAQRRQDLNCHIRPQQSRARPGGRGGPTFPQAASRRCRNERGQARSNEERAAASLDHQNLQLVETGEAPLLKAVGL